MTFNFACLFTLMSVFCLQTNAQDSGQTHDDTPKLKVLIVDGQNNHKNWPMTTKMVKHYLEQSDRFTVDVQTSKPKGTDPDFNPEFANYDVVVSNFGYGAADWPEATQQSFVEYMKKGGGLVVYHAADNSFPKWKAFNEMIGLGGWGGRNESSGPYVYLDQNGKEIRDNTKGPGGNHGPQHEFSVVIRDNDHPITNGLPSEFLHVKDELYQKLRGPAVNMKILGTSFSAKKFKGTDRHEPMVMTIEYGDGRIFHTPMGHGNNSCECVAFITLMQRGTEWAATGKVTIPVPEDFPTADKTSRRDFAKSLEAKANESAALGKRIAELISIVEKGDSKATFQSMLSPAEFKMFLESKNPEKAYKSFAEYKAKPLVEMLKSVDLPSIRIEGNDAKIEGKSGMPLRFLKVDGKWYLRN